MVGKPWGETSAFEGSEPDKPGEGEFAEGEFDDGAGVVIGIDRIKIRVFVQRAQQPPSRASRPAGNRPGLNRSAATALRTSSCEPKAILRSGSRIAALLWSLCDFCRQLE